MGVTCRLSRISGKVSVGYVGNAVLAAFDGLRDFLYLLGATVSDAVGAPVMVVTVSFKNDQIWWRDLCRVTYVRDPHCYLPARTVADVSSLLTAARPTWAAIAIAKRRARMMLFMVGMQQLIRRLLRRGEQLKTGKFWSWSVGCGAAVPIWLFDLVVRFTVDRIEIRTQLIDVRWTAGTTDSSTVLSYKPKGPAQDGVRCVRWGSVGSHQLTRAPQFQNSSNQWHDLILSLSIQIVLTSDVLLQAVSWSLRNRDREKKHQHGVYSFQSKYWFNGGF